VQVNKRQKERAMIRKNSIRLMNFKSNKALNNIDMNRTINSGFGKYNDAKGKHQPGRNGAISPTKEFRSLSPLDKRELR
jgi:hypothetical protein